MSTLTPRRLAAGAFLFLSALSAPLASHAALTFNLTNGAGLTSLQSSDMAQYNSVRGAFDQAAALWSNSFTDNVTVNITIDYAALGNGIIGSTGSSSKDVISLRQRPHRADRRRHLCGRCVRRRQPSDRTGAALRNQRQQRDRDAGWSIRTAAANNTVLVGQSRQRQGARNHDGRQ